MWLGYTVVKPASQLENHDIIRYHTACRMALLIRTAKTELNSLFCGQLLQLGPDQSDLRKCMLRGSRLASCTQSYKSFFLSEILLAK